MSKASDVPIPCDLTGCGRPAAMWVEWGNGTVSMGNLCQAHADEAWQRMRGLCAVYAARWTNQAPLSEDEATRRRNGCGAGVQQ